MNLTPPPPSQNSHAVRWHCTAESIIIIIVKGIYIAQVRKGHKCAFLNLNF